MRACVQRVLQAQVSAESTIVGEIGPGLVVLLGVGAQDAPEDVAWMAERITGLRVFDDSDGKMNLSLADVGGHMLVVSQFTLFGDCRRGRRPSFSAAAGPELAETLYNAFVEAVRRRGVTVATGRFRKQMLVSLVNDGPVTLWMDSDLI